MSAPPEVIQFLIDAGHCVPSEAALPNTSLEYRALYQSWRAALEAVGMTAEEARSLKDRDLTKGNGLTARGMKL